MKAGRSPYSRATADGSVRSRSVTMKRPATSGAVARAAEKPGSAAGLVSVGESAHAVRVKTLSTAMVLTLLRMEQPPSGLQGDRYRRGESRGYHLVRRTARLPLARLTHLAEIAEDGGVRRRRGMVQA